MYGKSTFSRSINGLSTRPILICVLAVVLLAGAQAAFAQSPPGYVLDSEDVINVVVMRHAELSGEFLVPTDGNVNFPRIGQTAVSGKTLVELADLITSKLKDTLRDPEVSVTLRSPRRQLVYVMGAVQRPGPFDVKPGWRLTEAISAAGGIPIGLEAADCTVTILRGITGTRESIPLREVMHGDDDRNPLVQAGDVLTVDYVEQIPIYVTGKVNRPGVYNIRSTSGGLLEAITMAGGPMDNAALDKVTVTRLNGESETINIIPVTLEGKLDTPVRLRSGDLVVVPECTDRFAVLGWVNSPGFFPMQSNRVITLSDALGMVRGTDLRRAGLKSVAILREVDGNTERMIYDYNQFSAKGDITQNPVIKPGDIIWIPETSSPDWDRILSRISSGLSLFWAFDRWSR